MTSKIEHDRIRLREAFYKAFDAGRLRHAAQSLAKGGAFPGFETVGAGMHFRCFVETPGVPGLGSRLRLVLKIASKEFISEVGNAAQWAARMQMVAGEALVPPFEILHLQAETTKGAETVALIMPYGPDPESCRSEWWLPRDDDFLRQFYLGLSKRDLHLGDLPQMRCWDGIPFIIDFSDLRPIGLF